MHLLTRGAGLLIEIVARQPPEHARLHLPPPAKKRSHQTRSGPTQALQPVERNRCPLGVCQGKYSPTPRKPHTTPAPDTRRHLRCRDTQEIHAILEALLHELVDRLKRPRRHGRAAVVVRHEGVFVFVLDMRVALHTSTMSSLPPSLRVRRPPTHAAAHHDAIRSTPLRRGSCSLSQKTHHTLPCRSNVHCTMMPALLKHILACQHGSKAAGRVCPSSSSVHSTSTDVCHSTRYLNDAAAHTDTDTDTNTNTNTDTDTDTDTKTDTDKLHQ